MIKVLLKDGKPAIKSDSALEASIFLWSIVVIAKLVDSWFIMVLLGAIHHIFDTSWAPPSFWLSLVISFAITGLRVKDQQIKEVAQEIRNNV